MISKEYKVIILSLGVSKNYYTGSHGCHEISVAASEDTRGKTLRLTTIPKLPLSFIHAIGSITYSKEHEHEAASALSNPHGSAIHEEADTAVMADDIE